ncbi:acyl carrier protein [Streptomyces sp. BK022]|uniref:acyl carrier protein n=1 Tax=Streptomyces sp. BK022 TaxID=2512123 RepID=UPI001028BF18|nr:acyl carrier protein [Streptomyces sp. BK022]RZU29458.1 acyl carrier protein [Streptomyces sp. BK022]
MYETLVDILTGRFQVRPELVTPETTPPALGLDSLFVVELSFVLEEEAGLKIGFDELAEADSVAGIARLMQDERDRRDRQDRRDQRDRQDESV